MWRAVARCETSQEKLQSRARIEFELVDVEGNQSLNTTLISKAKYIVRHFPKASKLICGNHEGENGYTYEDLEAYGEIACSPFVNDNNDDGDGNDDCYDDEEGSDNGDDDERRRRRAINC